MGWRLHTAQRMSFPSEPDCLLSCAGKWLSDDRKMAASSQTTCHIWEAKASFIQTVCPAQACSPCRTGTPEALIPVHTTGLHWSTEIWSVVLEDPTMQTWRHQNREQSRRLSGWFEGCCSLDVECSPRSNLKNFDLQHAVYWKIVEPWRGGAKCPWKG